MIRRVPTLLFLTLVAVLPAAADEGAAPPFTVSRVSGDTLRADGWTAVTDGALVLTAEGESRSVPLDDVIEIVTDTPPDPPRAFAASDVLVDLWSGEEIGGRIVSGDDFGITVRNPVLGEVRIAIDAVAGLRFPYRLSQAAERPNLDPSDANDIVHLVGGDRIDCTIARLEASALTCSTAADDEIEVPYERVTALRLMPTGEEPSDERALTVVLRDGSRVRGTSPQVADGRLILGSVSGFAAKAALDDVVSVLVESDSFSYLSDLDAAAVEIDPFWEPVAGDAGDIYAPRRDRAFSGGLLQAGGQTWLKGLGMFSGTTMTWNLDGAWRELRTHVAVDDAAGRLGSVVFVVLVDGEERWRSDLVVPAGGSAGGRGVPGPIDTGRISVEGAKTLSLRVLAGDDEDPYPIQDEADWLGAMLVR